MKKTVKSLIKNKNFVTLTVFSAVFVVAIVSMVFITTALGKADSMFKDNYPWAKPMFIISVILILGTVAFFVLKTIAKNDKNSYSPKFFIIVTGLLSTFTILTTYIYIGMWPFGENTVVMIDMYSQYMPLFSWLRNTLFGSGSNFIYSMQMGLGMSMMPTIGYYLASPLNILLIFFSEEYIAEVFLMLIIIKSVVSSIGFALCVQYISKKSSWVTPIVSILYSTSMFFIAYSWNIMWFDVVMILPFVIMSFERMMRIKKSALYSLLFAYAVFANFYMSYMLCIFVILYFIAYCVKERITGKDLLNSIVRFGLSSCLGFGVAAVLCIPTYYGLKVTSAADESLNKLRGVGENFDLLDLFCRQFYGMPPEETAVKWPNIASGILSLLSVPIFITTKAIDIRKKLAYSGLWLILALSIVLDAPNFLWSGMHYPNGLPFRFSFLYTFIVLLITYEVLINIKDVTFRQVSLTGSLLILYVFIMQKLSTEGLNFTTVYVTVGFVALYSVIFILSIKKKLLINVAYIIILFCIISESILSNNNTRTQMHNTGYFTHHDSYLANESAKSLNETMEKAVNIGNNETNEFYRINNANRLTFLDGALYNYNDISVFSSTYYYGTTESFKHLGLGSNGVNSIYLNCFMPTLQSLFGVKYYVSKSDIKSSSYLEKVETVKTGNTTRYIYRNNYALSLGYVGTNNLKDWKSTQYDPVKSQNSLYQALTGSSGTVLLTNQVTTANTEAKVTKKESGTAFSISDTGGSKTTDFTVTTTNPGNVFIYVDCGAAKEIKVKGSQTWTISKEPTFIDVGKLTEGQTLTVSITSEKGVGGSIYAVSINDEVYKAAISDLKANSFSATKCNNNYISGTAIVTKDSVLKENIMMTSIPYDEDWTVVVDGNKVETFSIDGGLLGFNIKKGNHIVEMNYWPKGLTAGIILSVFSVILLAGLFVIERKNLEIREVVLVIRDKMKEINNW